MFSSAYPIQWKEELESALMSTPLTVHRYIEGLTQRPMANLVNLTQLTACIWTVGGNRSTQREPLHTHKLHEEDPRLASGFEPRIFLV